MNKIKFKKSYCQEDEKFEFSYTGLVDDNYDNFKDFDIAKLLDNFGENNCHSDMVMNVSYLRTIFQHSKEQLLVVAYESEGLTKEVLYNNSELTYYSVSNNEYKVQYSSMEGLQFFYSKNDGTNKEINDDEKYDLILSKLKKFMESLKELSNCSSIKFTHNPCDLVSIYQLFYEEDPNFKDWPNVSIKFNSMMSILKNFGIIIDEKYENISTVDVGFSDTRMPFSFVLESHIKKLIPLVMIPGNNYCSLDVQTQKKVNIIGKTIRESIREDEDLNASLITISRIIWASHYDLLAESDTERLINNSRKTSEEVTNCIQLVKKIDEIIHN